MADSGTSVGLDIASQSGQLEIAEKIAALNGINLFFNYRDPEAESAILSKSYAVGGTNTRENEDTDNARYFYEQLAPLLNNQNIKQLTTMLRSANLDEYLNAVPVTLLAENWSVEPPYTQTVENAKITSLMDFTDPFVKFAGVQEVDDARTEALACLSGGITNDGSITFYCYESAPTINFTVYLRRVVS
jgi:hypothetical protein